MCPTPIASADTTTAMNLAAKAIVAFRSELERYGVARPGANAIVVSSIGETMDFTMPQWTTA